jgi:aldose 1-epimerase
MMSDVTNPESLSAEITLRSSSSTLKIDPFMGGRLSSLVVDGHDLLWRRTPGEGPFGWGSFVMAPYAGRIPLATFTFAGQTHHLPIAMAPHAIHGTTYEVPWTVTDQDASSVRLECEFGRDWPFRGGIVHEISLFDDHLDQRLTARAADVVQPITFGWHPWFPRVLRPGGSEVQWSFDRAGVHMFQRDSAGITTSQLVDVPEGRVDDCFLGVGTVKVEWPGEFVFDIEHDCPVIVLFDGLDHAICVEPQTGPPDVTSVWPGQCEVVPGMAKSANCTWRWGDLR